MGSAFSRRNEILSYYSTKNVQIRDWRLGGVYFLAVACAIAYVLVDVIFLNKAFLRYTPVVGVVRLDLGESAVARTKQTASEYSYCQNRSVDSPDFTPASRYDIDGGTMQRAHEMHLKQGTVGCVSMDGHDLVFPAHEESAIFITTAILELDQTRNGSALAGKLARYKSPPSTWYTVVYRDNYPQGVEDLTLTVGHTIFTASSEEMSGTLLDYKGRVHATFPAGSALSILLSDLLSAAGVSLDRGVRSEPGRAGADEDASSDANSTQPAGANASESGSKPVQQASGLTCRDSGLVLALQLHYSNTASGSLLPSAEPQWVLTPVVMDEDEFALDEMLAPVLTPGLRRLRHRSGVRIKAFQTGSLGAFSLQRLLLSIASGLVLIGTARAAVDFLAVFVLADRQRYRGYLYELTETLDDVEERAGRQQDKSVDLQHKTVGALFANRAIAHGRSQSSLGVGGYAQLEEGQSARGSAGRPAARWSPWAGSGAQGRAERAADESRRRWAVRRIQSTWRGYAQRWLSVPPAAHGGGAHSGGLRGIRATAGTRRGGYGSRSPPEPPPRSPESSPGRGYDRDRPHPIALPEVAAPGGERDASRGRGTEARGERDEYERRGSPQAAAPARKSSDAPRQAQRNGNGNGAAPAAPVASYMRPRAATPKRKAEPVGKRAARRS